MSPTKTPLVTVVVPIFNGERYLTEALNSVVSQSYRNLEIIVVDDGSSNPFEIERLVKAIPDARIKLIQKENGGVSTALNIAIKNANGKYFTWLSHDDVFHKQKVATQVNALELLQDTKTVHYTAYETIDSHGKIIHTAQLGSEVCKSVTPLGPVERGVLYGCAAMFNLSFLNSVGLFDENLRFVQDYDYWLKLVDAGAKFELLDKPLVKIRIHSEQTGKSQDTYDENFALWSEIAKRWVNYCETSYGDSSNLKYLKEFRKFSIQNKVEGAVPVLDDFERQILSKYAVSVIVPTRGRIHLLKRCIQSILDQNLHSLEVIVIDDNTDPRLSKATLEVLDSFKNPQILLHSNSHSRGPAGARNQGLDISKIGFVAFLDSDDYFNPGKLRLQLSEMLIHQTDFSHTNYLRHYEIEEELELVNTSHHSGKSQLRFILENGCGISTSTVMVRYSHPFSKIRFDEEKRFGEDIFYFLDFAYKSRQSFLHLDFYGTVMRHHVESASSNSHAQKVHNQDIEFLFQNKDLGRLNYTNGISHSARSRSAAKYKSQIVVHLLLKLTRPSRRILLKHGSRLMRRIPNDSILKRLLEAPRKFLLK